MNSMTGFGRGQATQYSFEVKVELTSVNRRNLEVSTSLPKEWQALERVIVEALRAGFRRGRIHASVQFAGSASQEGVSWDEEAVQSTLRLLQKTATLAEIPFQPDAATVVAVTAWHRQGALPVDTEQVEGLLCSAMDAAVLTLQESRAKEGQALAEDLSTTFGRLAELVTKIEPLAETVPAKYRVALFDRLRQAGLELDISDERVLKEVALFADRCDVAEELSRLRSHLEQGGEMLTTQTTKDPMGRQLEFLVQEIHREVNTIGSKANDIEVTRLVLSAKAEIERLREQLQNVE